MAELEEWRAGAGYEGRYEVSSLGRMRSLRRTIRRSDGRMTTKYGFILEPLFNPGTPDRARVCLYANSRMKRATIARVVAIAFLGPPPTGKPHAAHINGNSRDDRAANLVWASPLENEAHKTIHGTRAVGSQNPKALLTEDRVRQILRLKSEGMMGIEIGRLVGVDHSTVSDIVRGKSWKHVPRGDVSP